MACQCPSFTPDTHDQDMSCNFTSLKNPTLSITKYSECQHRWDSERIPLTWCLYSSKEHMMSKPNPLWENQWDFRTIQIFACFLQGGVHVQLNFHPVKKFQPMKNKT